MNEPSAIFTSDQPIEPDVARRLARAYNGPADVVSALAAVVAELPGIGKDQQASQAQGGYSYRGIEAITKSAAPLFAKYGIVFVPQVQSCEIREITVNNKPWTDTILTVRYRICGPGGPDDYLEATVVGIGRDNADKGANKALTQAFKYALIQTLCIADAKDDNDGTHVERDLPPAVVMATKAQVDAFNARILDLEDDQRSEFVAWKADQGFPWPWPATALEAMEQKLEEIIGAPNATLPGATDGSDDGPDGEPSPDMDKEGSDSPADTSPASPSGSVPEDDDDLGRPFVFDTSADDDA